MIADRKKREEATDCTDGHRWTQMDTDGKELIFLSALICVTCGWLGLVASSPIIGGVWPVTEWLEAFEKMHKGEVVKAVLKPI